MLMKTEMRAPCTIRQDVPPQHVDAQQVFRAVQRPQPLNAQPNIRFPWVKGGDSYIVQPKPSEIREYCANCQQGKHSHRYPGNPELHQTFPCPHNPSCTRGGGQYGIWSS